MRQFWEWMDGIQQSTVINENTEDRATSMDNKQEQ